MSKLSKQAIDALQMINDEYGDDVYKEIIENMNILKFELDCSVVNKYHIMLLQNTEFYYEDSEFGAPAIHPKRPYGNSGVISDIKEITELIFSTDEELKELHESLVGVLNLLIKNPDKSLNDLEGKSWKRFGWTQSKWNIKEKKYEWWKANNIKSKSWEV